MNRRIFQNVVFQALYQAVELCILHTGADQTAVTLAAMPWRSHEVTAGRRSQNFSYESVSNIHTF